MPGQVTRRRSNRWRGLALLAAAFLVASACGSSTPTPAPGEATAPISNAQPSAAAATPGAGTPAGGSPSPAPDASPPLSETLIAAAFGAGTITYEQSLLYRALALFDSPGLPEEFRSPVPDMGAATALLGEISQKESELSPRLLEQLAPYRVRPADPVSIFNNPPNQGSLGMVLALATPAPTWVSRSVDGTGARVWVRDGPFTQTQLERFADVVAKVWAQLPRVFRYPEPDKPGEPDLSVNPDSAIDLYLVNVSDLDPRMASCIANPGDPDCLLVGRHGCAASAPEYSGTSSSGYVLVDAALTEERLTDAVAHELTHMGQFAYDWQESTWLKESTATWAAYRVMQKLNLLPGYEYAWLPAFFATLDVPLTRTEANHAYGSWLFFLFASMEKGDAIVTKIWEAAAAPGVQGEKAVDQAFPFDTYFADFAVRNWNKEPVTPQYGDVAPDPFPAGMEPKILPNGITLVPGAGQWPLSASLAPLSSIYFDYVFEDAVRKATFENALAGVPNAHVWAIKKIGSTWAKPEDWSGSATMKFCRDAATQDLSELVLIISNSDMQKDLTGSEGSQLTTETTGCGGWVGEVRGQSRGGLLGGSAWQETSFAQVSFIPNPRYQTPEDVEFVLGSGTVSWTSQWTRPQQDPSSSSGQLCPTTVFSGSYQADPFDPAGGKQADGGLDFRPPSDAAPTAGTGASQYALRQYEAGGSSSIAYDPNTACVQHSGVSVNWWQIPLEAGAKASADGRTIEGTWSSTGEGGDFQYSWTWMLEYVGRP